MRPAGLPPGSPRPLPRKRATARSTPPPGRAAALCRRLPDLLGVAGPIAVITAYAVAGARTPGYDLVTQSLSQLSRLGAQERPLAVAGLLATGGSLIAACPAVARRARPALVGAGLASLGAAAFPLDGTRAAFRAHAVWVVAGYVALGLAPLLHQRRPSSWAVTAVAGLALPLTLLPPASGAAQRVGLATLLAWVAGTCALRLRG